MNRCQLLSSYVDDELEAARREDFDRHLGSCLSCRRELERVKKLRRTLLSLPQLEVAPVSIQQSRGQRPSVSAWASLGGLAAVLTLLTGLALAPSFAREVAKPSKTYTIKVDQKSYTIATRGQAELLSIGIGEVEASFEFD